MALLKSDESAEAFAAARQTMVDCQIRTFDVTDAAVLARFLEVPRENFVPSALRDLAYSDAALKIGSGAPGAAERLLPPMVLARLLQAAEIRGSDHILDIASGTGYSTAILAGLARNIVALEPDAEGQARVKANLAAADLGSIPVYAGPLHEGIAAVAPFDLILINGAIETNLDQLFAQLRAGGKLVTLSRATEPAGRHACHAVLFQKNAGDISTRVLFDAAAPVLHDFREAPAFQF